MTEAALEEAKRRLSRAEVDLAYWREQHEQTNHHIALTRMEAAEYAVESAKAHINLIEQKIRLTKLQAL